MTSIFSLEWPGLPFDVQLKVIQSVGSVNAQNLCTCISLEICAQKPALAFQEAGTVIVTLKEASILILLYIDEINLQDRRPSYGPFATLGPLARPDASFVTH